MVVERYACREQQAGKHKNQNRWQVRHVTSIFLFYDEPLHSGPFWSDFGHSLHMIKKHISIDFNDFFKKQNLLKIAFFSILSCIFYNNCYILGENSHINL